MSKVEHTKFKEVVTLSETKGLMFLTTPNHKSYRVVLCKALKQNCIEMGESSKAYGDWA